MGDDVKQGAEHPLKNVVDSLEMNKAEIARRYGCSTNFIHNCLAGRYATPERMDALLQQMIRERAVHLQSVLNNMSHLLPDNQEDSSGYRA